MSDSPKVHVIELPQSLTDPDVLKAQIDCAERMQRADEIVVSMANIEGIDSTGLAVLLRVYSYSVRTGKRFRVQHVGDALRQQLRDLGLAQPFLSHVQRLKGRPSSPNAACVESMQPAVRTGV